MYLYVFLLLFSCRASSYFLPLTEVPFLQNKTKSAIIDEMLCLLDAEKTPLNEQFTTPTHLKNLNCAHNNTEEFIHELSRLNKSVCMNTVKEDMRKLRDNCSILKKNSSHGKNCTDITADFSKFKNNLEEFLKWVSERNDCRSIVRSESDLYVDSKCTCPHPQKYRKG